MKKFLETIKNIWKIEELRNRILVTLGILAIYRLGSFVVIPGVGTFKSGMKVIKINNYDEKIFNYLSKPNSFIYVICLCMQLLLENIKNFG